MQDLVSFSFLIYSLVTSSFILGGSLFNAMDTILVIGLGLALLVIHTSFYDCVGTSVGLVILVITITCACLIHDRRKLQHIKNQYFRRHGGLQLYEEMKSKQGLAFKIFSEEELQQATNKFDEHQVLGQGGNGIVYKGHLKDNLEVAVKRCMTIDEQKKKEFGKEMLIYPKSTTKTLLNY